MHIHLQRHDKRFQQHMIDRLQQHILDLMVHNHL